jgi:hypothetical protein
MVMAQVQVGGTDPSRIAYDGLLEKDIREALGQSAMERADIRLSADGSYTVTVTLETEAVEQGTMLTLAGFRPVTGGYRLVQKGRF